MAKSRLSILDQERIIGYVVSITSKILACKNEPLGNPLGTKPEDEEGGILLIRRAFQMFHSEAEAEAAIQRTDVWAKAHKCVWTKRGTTFHIVPVVERRHA